MEPSRLYAEVYLNRWRIGVGLARSFDEENPQGRNMKAIDGYRLITSGDLAWAALKPHVHSERGLS